MLKQLVAASIKNLGQIVAADYGTSVGAPAVFPKNFFRSLASIADEAGAKKLILKHSDSLIRVPLTEAAQDIDTPEQYQKLEDIK